MSALLLLSKTRANMRYSERHKQFPKTVIISYPMRWAGSTQDHRFWMSEFDGEVLDYDSKKHLIEYAIANNLPYVVLRVHRNGNATNIACTRRAAGAV